MRKFSPSRVDRGDGGARYRGAAGAFCRWSVPAALLLLSMSQAAFAADPAPAKDSSAPAVKSDAKADAGAWRASWHKKWQAEQRKKTAQAASAPTAAAPAPAETANSSTRGEDRSRETAGRAGKEPAKASTPGYAAQTRPDGTASSASTDRTASARTLDSPLSAVGDGGRMLITMLPVLLGIVGALHLLRRYQERTGRLPGLIQGLSRGSDNGGASAWGRRNRSGGGLQALLAGFQQKNPAVRSGGIRLVESLPLSGANLHVVEVRGRALLLGVTGASVQMLAELTEPGERGGTEFMAHLQAAAADLDALDLEDPETPVETLVGSLESVMQETHATISRRARRLRAVREEEEDAGA